MSFIHFLPQVGRGKHVELLVLFTILIGVQPHDVEVHQVAYGRLLLRQLLERARLALFASFTMGVRFDCVHYFLTLIIYGVCQKY